jgi:hypothetical protein
VTDKQDMLGQIVLDEIEGKSRVIHAYEGIAGRRSLGV